MPGTHTPEEQELRSRNGKKTWERNGATPERRKEWQERMQAGQRAYRARVSAALAAFRDGQGQEVPSPVDTPSGTRYGNGTNK